MIKNFQKYSEYFDLLYSGKDYEREAKYVDRHIRSLNPDATLMLELGSGTGNHARYFSQAGYSITGIERSAEMAALSVKKNIQGFEPVVADMSSFALDRQFDVVVSLFHSFCYLTTNDLLLDCLSTVYRHLKPAGIFCFDFWYGPAVLNDLPVTRVKRIHSGDTELLRIAETEMITEQNVAIVNYEMIIRSSSASQIESVREQHPMRYLSLPELDLLCRQAGFELRLAESFLDGLKPSLSSWNVFAVLQKID